MNREPTSPRLTQRQEDFVREYLVDLNASQAARRAGYSPTSAKANCTRLLNHPAVRARIDQLTQERAERVELRADDIVRRLCGIADQAEAQSNWNAAIRALELLGRHLGMWTDRYVAELKFPEQVFVHGHTEAERQRCFRRLAIIAGCV